LPGADVAGSGALIGGHDGFIEYRTHFRWAVLLVLLAFSVLALRLFQVQIVDGKKYETLAMVSHVVRNRIQPARGSILDREGSVLATDVEVSDLALVPHYVREPAVEIARLKDLGVLTGDEAAKVLETITQAKTDKKKRFHRLTVKKNLVGSRCPDDLTAMNFDPATSRLVCPKCGGTQLDQRAVVQSHLHELPGISLQSRMVRWYPARGLTSHAVGFVNEVSASEVERSERRLRAGDVVGRSGIERALDDSLRGVPGEDVFVRSAGGRRVETHDLPDPFRDLVSTPPIAGKDVTLTIDVNLQQAAATALARYRSGAVVALDADTGEVLAMVSHPTFEAGRRIVPGAGANAKPVPPVTTPPSLDPKNYAPMMNKAVEAYPPGSTFKILTTIAALMEGLAAEDLEMNCPGFYMFRGHKFRCFKHYGHGDIALVDAISKSCDVYFYILGEQLGIDTLAHWARDVFGVGEPTGIEISERAGLIPTERWYLRRRHQYQPGFALNTSVGQGDVRATPLAMARAYAAVVNGGRLMRPHLVRNIHDPVTGADTSVAPEVQRQIEVPEEFLDLVKRGMFGAVNTEDGTASSTALPELPFAGKTGTAQARERRPGAGPEMSAWLQQDHAWFVGYGPAKRPRLVVAAFVEHGGFGGAEAAPVARKVFEAYYAAHADEFSDLWQGFEEDVLEVVR
jgi:penicillin-binding protein 2